MFPGPPPPPTSFWNHRRNLVGATMKNCGQRLNIHMIDLNRQTEEDWLR